MTLEELLRLGDEDFVLQAYRTMLGREADEAGIASYLEQVRQGADKSTLLWALARSREGRERGVQMEGLAALLDRHDAPRPNRLQRAVSRLMQPFRAAPLEPVLRQQRALDNRLYRIESLLLQQAAALKALESRLARAPAGEAPSQPVAGAVAAAQALPERLVPPAANRHYRDLVTALAWRQGPGH